MKFFGIVLPVCSLMILCPLMAQINTGGVAASNVAEAEAPASLPPDAPASLAIPVKIDATRDAKSNGRALYQWSLAAVAGGNAADAFSSWHQPEANPLLAGRGSEFDGRSVLLKSAFVGASFLIEHWALRQNPRLYRTFAWLNFTIAGVLGGVVAHNIALR
jgi:hypothetical protein